MRPWFIVFVILIPLILILGSARLVVFNTSLHERLFLIADVPFDNAGELNDDVIGYLKGDKEKVETDVFTDKEKDHLRDVKVLIN
ncbi:hypothetical protein KY328_03025, partial [Candidatus Woesearchaeota archaeon]|nr:hypothetical protein [Candidatus Woesearchaeota archaeon]